MKILIAIAASLALLAVPAVAKHGGSGGGSHHSKKNSDAGKGDKDEGGKQTKSKGDKTKDASSKDNPLATFLNTVTKKGN